MRLDAGGAFVNGGDPRVPVVLRGAGFLYVAHAAMHLHPQIGDLLGQFAAPAFDDGGQQGEAFGVSLPDAGVRCVAPVIHRGRDAVGDGAHGLATGLHQHQHPAHIRVVDDLGPSRLSRRSALLPLPGVAQGLLPGALADAEPLQPHPDAGVVHYREHAGDALMLAAHQMPHRAAIVAVAHHAGGAAVDA